MEELKIQEGYGHVGTYINGGTYSKKCCRQEHHCEESNRFHHRAILLGIYRYTTGRVSQVKVDLIALMRQMAIDLMNY